jgi:hypothetical protein
MKTRTVAVMFLWCLMCFGTALNFEETDQLVKVARADRSNAGKYLGLAVSEGDGPSRVDALYELYQLHSQSPEKDFLLLIRLLSPLTGS